MNGIEKIVLTTVFVVPWTVAVPITIVYLQKKEDNIKELQEEVNQLKNIGAQGPKGEKGNVGTKGLKGEQGIQGVKGDDGDIKMEDITNIHNLLNQNNLKDINNLLKTITNETIIGDNTILPYEMTPTLITTLTSFPSPSNGIRFSVEIKNANDVKGEVEIILRATKGSVGEDKVLTISGFKTLSLPSQFQQLIDKYEDFKTIIEGSYGSYIKVFTLESIIADIKKLEPKHSSIKLLIRKYQDIILILNSVHDNAKISAYNLAIKDLEKL